MKLDDVFGNGEFHRELEPVRREAGNMGRRYSGEL